MRASDGNMAVVGELALERQSNDATVDSHTRNPVVL
jgi:hypothetical protein